MDKLEALQRQEEEGREMEGQRREELDSDDDEVRVGRSHDARVCGGEGHRDGASQGSARGGERVIYQGQGIL